MEGLIAIHNRFHSIGWLNKTFKAITFLGDVGIIWLVLATVFFMFKKTRKCSLMLFMGLALGFLFNNLILKNIFNRTRPFYVNEEFKNFILSLKMELPSESSFPSGHAFSSFCSATIILINHKKIGNFAMILAFLIAISRVYLCVHYPTDVVAGAIIGALFATFVVYICKLIEIRINLYKRDKVRKNVS